MNNKSHLSYGLVTGLALLVYSLALYFTDQSNNPVLKYGTAVIMLVGTILSCLNYSKIHQGAVSFGEVFTTGFKTAAIYALISVAFTVVFLIVFPDIKDKALEAARQQMEEQHKPQEVIDSGLAIAEKFFMAFAIGGSLFGCLLYGAVFSLLGAVIAKKNVKPDQVSTIGDNAL